MTAPTQYNLQIIKATNGWIINVLPYPGAAPSETMVCPDDESLSGMLAAALVGEKLTRANQPNLGATHIIPNLFTAGAAQTAAISSSNYDSHMDALRNQQRWLATADTGTVMPPSKTSGLLSMLGLQNATSTK